MRRRFIALAVFCLGCICSASANVLAPGQASAPDSFGPTGHILAETSGVISSVDYVVDYKVGVYQDNANVLCSGCLDFYYVFQNNGPGGIERFSASDFAGWTIDVGVDGFHSGQDPVTVDRSADGSVVDFNFNGNDTLGANSGTNILVIETNSTEYSAGMFTVQDGFPVSEVGYAPFPTLPSTVAPTPEPSSFALLGTGVLGVAGVVRKRFA